MTGSVNRRHGIAQHVNDDARENVDQHQIPADEPVFELGR